MIFPEDNATSKSSWINLIPFNYGWIIVMVAWLGMFMSGPGQTFVVAIFVDPIIEDTGWSRTTVSGVYTAGSIGAFIGAIIAGRSFDKFGARVVLTAVAALFGLATVLMGQVTHPAHLFLGFWGIRSLGQTALSMVSTSTVNIWFIRLRGKATAITSLAAPVSQIALPPLVYFLIVNNGWRTTWVILGIAIWVVLLPPAILLIRRTPESVGLKPDMGRKDVVESSHSQSSVKEESWTSKHAMRTKAFWLIIFAGTAGSLIGTAMTFHHMSILNSRGITDTQATLVLSLTAAVGVFSTMLTGHLLDKLPNRFILAAGQLALMASMAWIFIVQDLWHAVIYGIFTGIAQGLIYTTMIVIFPNYFGRRHLGTIMGVATIGMVVSSGLGPLPFGALYEMSNNYDLAIISFLPLPALCTVAALFAPPPTHKLD
ncbi:MAG: MFS transporter [SAR202 cluster bacterium]|mgnify:CR=1 FL=1|nr:MFS transporter [SAR202 cluster bacterium]